MLNFNGVLEGPNDLESDKNHYVGWTIQSGLEREWLWTGWKSKENGAFYSHEIEDMRNPETIMLPQKHKKQNNCKRTDLWQKCKAKDTWKMKNFPILAR
jgi:hypothetical protein